MDVGTIKIGADTDKVWFLFFGPFPEGVQEIVSGAAIEASCPFRQEEMEMGVRAAAMACDMPFRLGQKVLDAIDVVSLNGKNLASGMITASILAPRLKSRKTAALPHSRLDTFSLSASLFR